MQKLLGFGVVALILTQPDFCCLKRGARANLPPASSRIISLCLLPGLVCGAMLAKI